MTAAPRFKFDHSAAQRDCALYYVDVIDHETGLIVRGDYVGETGRRSFVRFLEHAYDQPWGDLIVGQARVDLREFKSKAEVLTAEEDAVRHREPRPRLNYEYNLDNPDRIPIWKQRAQRAERDAAKGVESRWLLDGKPNPAYGTAQAKTPTRAPRPNAVPTPKPPHQPVRKSSRLPVKWRRRRNWAFAWLASTLVLWAMLALLTARVVVSWQVLPIGAAGAVSAAYVFHLPKRQRKTAWTIVGVVTVVLAALAVQR